MFPQAAPASPEPKPSHTAASVAAVQKADADPRIGIGFKLTTLIVLLVAVALVGSTLVANAIITRTFGTSAETKTRETAKAVDTALQGLTQQIAIRTDATGSTEDFQKSLSFKETSDVERVLRDLTKRSSSDVALVVGNDGEFFAASKGEVAQLKLFVTSQVLADARAKHVAVAGAYPIGGKIYLVAVQPIEYIGASLGFLLNARQLNDAVCDDLARRSGAEIAIFDGTGLLARSQGVGPLTLPLARLWSDLSRGATEAIGGRIESADDRFFLYASPLKTPQGLAAGRLTAISEKDIVAAQASTNRGFLLISLIIGVVAAGVGFVFARRLSRPISEITRSFTQIATSGDLSLRIDKPYPDEIGRMARSFNVMQERVFKLHQQVAAAEERMRKELEMAAVLQELLFSRTGTVSPAFECVGFNKTSSETGGDWFAIFEEPQRGRTVVVIADVTGHGAPAALITAITHGFFHGNRQPILDGTVTLPELLQRLNRTVLEAANGSLVMTLFIAAIDHKTRRMTYINAAHPQPFHVRPQVGRPRPLASPPTAQIGISLDSQFVEREVQLEPGDVLFLFTDGLVECENMEGDQHGMQRLISALKRSASTTAPPQLRDHVAEQAFNFYGKKPIADDVTFIVCRTN